MILDTLEQADRYCALHPLFRPAFEFLRSTSLETLPAGRHPIDGDRLYVSIDDVAGRGRDGAKLESHRQYIDIQLAVHGPEEIGWRPLHDCPRVSSPYDADADIAFYDGEPAQWLALPPGHFLVFFPGDAHAPLAAHGPVRKAVVKVGVRI